jgi:hypothetical protein
MGKTGGAAPAGWDTKLYLRGSEALLLSTPPDSAYGSLAIPVPTHHLLPLRPPLSGAHAWMPTAAAAHAYMPTLARRESRKSVHTPSFACARAHPSPLVFSCSQCARLPLAVATRDSPNCARSNAPSSYPALMRSPRPWIVADTLSSSSLLLR